MSPTLSILMLISSFTPLIGGAEKQAMLLAQTLARRGHQVQIITRHVSGTPKHETVHGVSIWRVGSHRPGKIWSILSALKWIWSVWKIRNKIDILHAHQPYSSALTAGLLGRLTKKPVICKIPGNRAANYYLLKRKWILESFISAFIVPNKSIEQAMIDNHSVTKIHLIPNGERFFENNSTTLVRNSNIVLFVGRLQQVKGADILLKAIPRVLQSFPKAHFIFIGDGSQRDNLEDRAKQMGVSNAVTFTGFLERSQVEKYYSTSSLMVNSSRSEGICNAILEAINHKLPLVASNINGNKDLLADEETALLFEINNIHQLSDAILRILKNPELGIFLADHAYQETAQKYDIERVADAYELLYKDLLFKLGKE